jgi:hypothetical protein
MKVKVSTVLASLAAIFLLTLSVKAQEEMPVLEPADPTRRESNLDEDKTLIYEHPSHSSATKDTTQVFIRVTPSQPAKALKTDNHKNGRREKEEEDALSFNVLYYMFQKFKMSDWIDQN